MSRRIRYFKRYKGATEADTYSRIVAGFRAAADKNGAVITRPIKPEKAKRLAAAQHRAISKLR